MAQTAGFMVYHSDGKNLEMLDNDSLGAIMRALIRYAREGEEPANLDPMTMVVFAMLREKIDFDALKYQKKSEAGAKSGGRPKAEESSKKQTEADGSKNKQTEAEESSDDQTGVNTKSYTLNLRPYTLNPKSDTILSDSDNGGEAANAHACARERNPAEQPPEVDAYWADVDAPDTDDGNVAVSENATTTRKSVKKAKKPTDAALIAEAIKDYADGDAELEGLLQDWMANRKAKRSPATIRAIQINLDKLDAMAQESGMSVKAYLRDVIARGWAAFFVIRDGGGGGYRASPPPQQPQSTADYYLQLMQEME